MKRLSIFCIYDSEGIIDRYIGYSLKELRMMSDTLIVVCNMESIKNGIELVEAYADYIYYRKNVGLDAGAFKDAIIEYVGWDKVKGYDELILMNDSLYGPFISMKEIFKEMEKKSVDFWGLLKCAEFEDKEINYPEHIHSFFIVFKQKLISSEVFKKFWAEMPYYKDYTEAVEKYETKLTSYFSSFGYTYDTLANSEINYAYDKKNNYPQCSWIPYELIVRNGFPFLKRHVFRMQPAEILQKGSLGQLRCVLEYIAKETDYDVDLILENLIRIYSAENLIYLLNLIYFFDRKSSMIANNTLLVISRGLSNQFTNEIDIIGQYKKAVYINNYVEIENYINEDYKYVGFIGYFNLSDSNGSIQSRITKAEIFRLNINMSTAPEAIFEKNKYLGMIFVPSAHYDIKGFYKTPQLNGLWIRKSLVHIWWDNTIECMEDLVRQVQKEGYYSAIYENVRYVPIDLSEKSIRDKDCVLKIIDDLSYLKSNSDYLFIYGTGNIAELYHELFYGADGYVISDGKQKLNDFYGKPVFYLSELNETQKIGIYVCLSSNNAMQIKENLKNRDNIIVKFYSG